MRAALVVALVALMQAIAPPREVRIPVSGTTLYARDIGKGPPVIVIHGGPDFDHRYLLPDMDRLADAFRLIYYDQRGRGQSAEGVKPEDVTIASDVADLDAVRGHFQLGPVALLGHSWGALIALEYAIRHPERVSHLVLMNPAPVSAEDFLLFRKERTDRLGANLDQLRALQAGDGYKRGDPDTVAAYYRILFGIGVKRPEDLERVVAGLRASFTSEGILEARAVEDRLVAETWLAPDYDLFPKLARLEIPTLVIASDDDFIPAAAVEHIARTIPNARLVTMKDCGHFSYLECPAPVHKSLDDFFRGASR